MATKPETEENPDFVVARRRQLVTVAINRDIAGAPVEMIESRPVWPWAVAVTVKSDCGNLPFAALWKGPPKAIEIGAVS